MKQKTVQVVSHDEKLSKAQIENLISNFSLELAKVWLSKQNLEKKDYSYVVSKVKEV